MDRFARLIVLSALALSVLPTACGEQASPTSHHPPASSPRESAEPEVDDDFDNEDLERELDAIEDELDAPPAEEQTPAKAKAPHLPPVGMSLTPIEESATAVAAHATIVALVAAPFAALTATRPR